MPTSSQALILVKCEPQISNDNDEPQTQISMLPSSITPYPLSRVVLSGETIASVKSKPNHHRTDAMALLQPLTTRGLPGVLSFDSTTKAYKWHIVNETDLDLPRDRDLEVKDFMTKYAPNYIERSPSKTSVGTQASVDFPRIDNENRPNSVTSGKVEKDIQLNEQELNAIDKKLLELGFRRNGVVTVNLQKLLSPRARSSCDTSNDSRSNTPSPNGSTKTVGDAPSRSSPCLPSQKTKHSVGIVEPTPTLKEVEELLGLRKPGSNEAQKEQTDEEKEAKAILRDPKWRQKLKRMKLHTVRLRKDLPPLNNLAVVVLLPDDSMTHAEMKKLVEDQTGEIPNTIQYDPVQTQIEDPDVGCRWIATFDSVDICRRICHQGLFYRGEAIRVRMFDIVVKEEHRAYKLVDAIQEEQKKCSLTTISKRNIRLSKDLGSKIRATNSVTQSKQ